KDPELPWDIYSNPTLLKQLLSPRGFLVAEIRDHIVGFLHYRIFRKRPWFDPSVKKYGQILELHVKDSFQRLGIGSRLMHDAIEALEDKGVRVIYTHTDETNTGAMKLYKELGFRPFLKTLYLRRRHSKFKGRRE
ncbi:MAG TPA: GNAT family N-acetyltransferase, partial [Candidatus Binatus sp.]|nr:GNAT family N-acetyltransferase [Candidatus Binatus sp.]